MLEWVRFILVPRIRLMALCLEEMIAVVLECTAKM
jgi:hypothetical protein